MKNIVNYLDEFIDENTLCETVIKSKKKSLKKQIFEDEIGENRRPMRYNKSNKNKKYTRRDKLSE